jgi:predicted nucleic acid-binding protein
MTILDSNIWIAWLNPQDNQHVKATKLIKGVLQKTTITLPDHIISEVITVLTIKVSKPAANKFIDMVTRGASLDVLYTNEQLFQSVLRFYYESLEIKLSFVDTLLLYLGQDHEVLTFDKNLQKAID